MKKLLIFYGLLISTSLTGNPIVDVLNKIHKISDQYWKNHDDYPIKSHSEAMGYSMKRFGGGIEGVGELADIAALVAGNAQFIRSANIIAAIGRVGDVVFGSFPQLPLCWVDSNGNPTWKKRAIGIEEPELHFWPTAWQRGTPNSTKTIIPPYLALHGINQLGKAFDIKRAIDRIKHAPLLAWYSRKLTKKQRLHLHIEQFVHATILTLGLMLKHKQQYDFLQDRYPWLIGEALVSFLRRWRMQHVQNDLLDRARMAAEHEGKSF